MNLIKIISRLTGESIDVSDAPLRLTSGNIFLGPKPCFGFSQFNEILLSLGQDRICREFYEFLILGRVRQEPSDEKSNFCSLVDLDLAVTRFEQMALLCYGSVKHAFKTFSRDPQSLSAWVDFYTELNPERFATRLDAVIPIQQINPNERLLLGYIAANETKAAIAQNPTTEENLQKGVQLERTQTIGVANQDAYLFSEHLDVYVATSMREPHEFLFVAKFCKDLFEREDLQPLKLRYFDPTLAYTPDRIDKGLCEALMLRRAKCTIFLAQETDTLGKDSELASTLAQGKTVIAYVPTVTDEYFQEFSDQLFTGATTAVERKNKILNSLKSINPGLAWTDRTVQSWLQDAEFCSESELLTRLKTELSTHYDKRATVLEKNHPLGIQVHLATGVAVGVLVVRNIDHCAQLLVTILQQSMTFTVARLGPTDKPTHLVLRETISGSIFRVMTYNKNLSNAFWNFYLRK
jgi:hypothetical protein